jgi:hypothetical protein
MSDVKNQTLSWLAFVFPPLLAWFLFEFDWLILSEVDKEYPSVQWIVSGLALIPGWYLFKRSRVIKDHEWHRVKELSSLRKVYSAEDKGAWTNEDRVLLQGSGGAVELGELGMAALGNMQGNIGNLTRDTVSPEIQNNPDAKVEMLLDADHVTRTTSRIEGKEMMSDSLVTNPTRAEPKKASPMDRVIDKIGDVISGKGASTPTDVQTAPEQINVNVSGGEYDDLLAFGDDSKVSEPSRIADVKYCRSCESENSLEERYCVACGSDI